MDIDFILKGDICHSRDPQTLVTIENGYVICINGISQGVFPLLPAEFSGLPVIDCEGSLIIPGLCDLHMHAPQYAFRGLGMDLELLEWLNTKAFPEEAKYSDIEYAEKAYSQVTEDLIRSATTRLCIYATVHTPSTIILMDMLERSGLVSMVGKVNMDRNTPDYLCEKSATASAEETRRWLESVSERFTNTTPILTPRFIPSCSDELLRQLSSIQQEYNLPVQSHLSENRSEIEWVAELCPNSSNYADAYECFGLLGGDIPTVMAHCVWPDERELALLRSRGVFIAHCPQSNTNLASGIAPARKFLTHGLRTGLGSDVAGGSSISIFRAMSDAIHVSKLRWRLVEQADSPLTVEEVFWLGTAGGGEFFGKVGKFDPGYEFDAVIVDDSSLASPFPLTLQERLSRVIYLSEERHVKGKFVRGKAVIEPPLESPSK